MAARLAAERLQEGAELSRIHSLQAQMDSMQHSSIESFAQYMELNEAFHAELLILAKSPMLARSLAHVNSLPFAAPSAMVFARTKLPRAHEMFILGQEQHHSIIEALERRQGTRAQYLATEHAQLARRNLQAGLSQEGILSCVPGASLIAVALN